MAGNKLINAGLRLVQQVVKQAIRTQERKRRRGPDRRDEDRGGHTGERTGGRREPVGTSTGAYPGDFTGRPRITYAPLRDDLPDPGEIVWTWVPYEEDPTRGKDRPALIIGLDGEWLLVLQVTSKDNTRDAAWEESQGRYWLDIGPGEWDREGRPSEVRVNRIIRIDPDKVRRIGAILDEERFNLVAQAVLEHY